jgi:hypothetical protein
MTITNPKYGLHAIVRRENGTSLAVSVEGTGGSLCVQMHKNGRMSFRVGENFQGGSCFLPNKSGDESQVVATQTQTQNNNDDDDDDEKIKEEQATIIDDGSDASTVTASENGDSNEDYTKSTDVGIKGTDREDSTWGGMGVKKYRS